MVVLPSHVLGAKVEGTGMLEVRREHHGLVASLAGKLNSQIPGIEGDEYELEVREVLGEKGIEAIDCIPEGTRVPDVLPSQGRQAGCGRQVVLAIRQDGTGENIG